LGARKVSFAELLGKADYISIHVPLKPDTHHLFNAEAFQKMKSSAFLINTARGPIIHEAELVDALKAGEIAGAALDVYEFEPQMIQGLADLENAVTAPHVASATPSARNGMSELAARNLLAMLRGSPGPSCLNPEVFD
jgi:glyoxylate reductase